MQHKDVSWIVSKPKDKPPAQITLQNLFTLWKMLSYMNCFFLILSGTVCQIGELAVSKFTIGY